MARSRQEALAYIQQNKRSLPDLVLLDASLPDGSGFDVCREMRHRYNKNQVCVCVYVCVIECAYVCISVWDCLCVCMLVCVLGLSHISTCFLAIDAAAAIAVAPLLE
jgi:hypothetical protein